MADIMEQIGDALALVDDAGMTSASEAWAPPTAATPASQAREPRLQWSPNTEPQVPIAEQLLSPAAQHRSELARHFAQAAAVAFATPAAAASYTPPPLPAHKYPHITRSSFAGHVTRLRQARVAAGLPPVPPRAVADTPPKSAVGGQPSGAAAPAATATAASHVPAMFFSREFRLSSAKSFACVLSGEFGATLGSQQSALDDTAASQQLATAALRDTHAAAPTISSLRVSPALQHTLTNYLDFVEGDLASRITGRKEQLFNALHTLHTLWNSVVVANNAVVATKERVARSRAVLSQQALRLLALRQRQSRAKALKQKLLQLRELATQKKSIVRMLSRGSHASALAACRALRASVQQAAQGSLRCASSLLEAIASLEAATADAVSKQFNSDAMGVISGALDASSALHVLSRGSLSSAAAAAVRAYVQGWQASHSAQAATAESGSDSSSLLQVLAWSGPLGCEAALLQFVLRRQLGTLGSLGAGTMQACLETLSGKVVREVKALITTEVCEGVRVLQLREAASAAWAAEGGAAETPGSNPFEYDWESVGGDSVSISTVQCLAFSDFCDMLVSLLVSLHRCLRRVARLHNLVQQVAHNLAQSPLENTATPPITADDAAIVSLLSRDVVVSAAGTAQKQVAKLLRARRAVHGSLKVSHMGALMAVCDAFAHSCASLTHEASSSGSASPPGEAELAVGGSELMLEAATQVRSAMKTLHTRNMTSLPALLDAEVWKAVSVQPAFHALVLDLCAPGLLGSAAVNQALPSLRRTLAAQSSTIADELASGTLARLGESVSSDKTASGAVLLSALGQALPLRCVAEWPQLRTAAEASTLKLEVHLDGPSVKAMPCSAGTPPSLVTQQPPPPATQRLHVPVDAASGVKVVHSEATHAHMQVDVLPFTVVGAALMLLKMMEDYVSAARLMPHAISGDAATKLAELLRKFNTKTTQLVLSGGAVTNGTLKTIYAKHLAVTATSLRAMSCLLPAVRSSLSCVLPAAQHGMLKDLWRVGQDLEKHVERIFDKFSSILQATFAQSLENIGSVDWNKHSADFDTVYPRLVRDAMQGGAAFVTSTPSSSVLETAQAQQGPVWQRGLDSKQAAPTKHMRDVIKNTETLHRIISASLSSDDLCRVFSSVAVMLSAQLPVLVVSANFTSLSEGRPQDGALSDEGLSDYGNKRLAWDVVSLLVMLRQVPGLGVYSVSALAAASSHEDLTAGQVALTSIESWVKRQFGVVLSPQLYTAFGVGAANEVPPAAPQAADVPTSALDAQGQNDAASPKRPVDGLLHPPRAAVSTGDTAGASINEQLVGTPPTEDALHAGDAGPGDAVQGEDSSG